MIKTSDKLPPDETPVLIKLGDGQFHVAEVRLDEPGPDDSYAAHRYWIDPHKEYTEWELDQVVEWTPLPVEVKYIVCSFNGPAQTATYCRICTDPVGRSRIFSDREKAESFLGILRSSSKYPSENFSIGTVTFD